MLNARVPGTKTLRHIPTRVTNLDIHDAGLAFNQQLDLPQVGFEPAGGNQSPGLIEGVTFTALADSRELQNTGKPFRRIKSHRQCGDYVSAAALNRHRDEKARRALDVSVAYSHIRVNRRHKHGFTSVHAVQ